MKRLNVFFSLLLCCALLCGCSGAANTDELLRAPRLSGSYSALQDALNDWLGEPAQLKYPASGDFLSPFVNGDWNGDGTQDAAVLFLSGDSANVQIAVLMQDEKGQWQVNCVTEGLADSVDTVETAKLRRDGADQLVVSYPVAGSLYLAVYDYAEDALQPVMQQPFTQYIHEEFTGSGSEDMVLLSTNEQGETDLLLFTDGSEGYTLTRTTGLDSEHFAGYASLAAGKGSYGGSYLVLDGYTSDGYLASGVFRCNAETGGIEPADLTYVDDIFTASLRYALCLTSRDIDGDGVVEIPVQAEETGTLNFTANRRYSFVQWMDYTRMDSEKCFGIVDENNNYFLELPSEWEGNIMLVDGEDDTFVVSNLSGDVPYMTLKLGTTVDVQSGWHRIGVVDGRQLQYQTENRSDASVDVTLHRLED